MMITLSDKRGTYSSLYWDMLTWSNRLRNPLRRLCKFAQWKDLDYSRTLDNLPWKCRYAERETKNRSYFLRYERRLMAQWQSRRVYLDTSCTWMLLIDRIQHETGGSGAMVERNRGTDRQAQIQRDKEADTDRQADKRTDRVYERWNS